MFIEDITVEVRDESYQRVGQILPKDLVGFKAVLRFNNVGTWEITLPANHDVGDILRLPGSGIIVTGPDGVLISGPTISAQNTVTSENSNGDWIISGVDDSVILAERLAYPSPAVADVTAQTAAYDVRHTLASTAMYGYVEDNIGPYAHATRRIVNLDVAADAGLGSYVYPAARFDILGELLAGIASVDGLGFDIVQDGDILRFSVYQPVDRSGQIRMDVHNNTLASTEYAYEAHSLSRAIVAGQGDGLNRTFIEVSSTESVAAENLWNRRIERFVDQRNTDDLNELQQAGIEKLADGGMTLTSVDVTPSSDLTMVYGVDWNLGDKVTVVVDEQEVATVVTAVSMSIESDGIRIGATVGQPTGVDFESKVAKHTQNTTQRVNALERKEVPAITWNDAEGTYEFVMKGGNVTQQIGAEQLAYVKNNTGATLLNGRAVYPNGSTGANKLVAYAQANSESTSTQTFGVLTEDIANGGHGWVTTFGMVHDIDTSALTEGAAVWLSPTVPGGLTSTKPVAPNHMVLIGFCVRSHAVNGSIFVKVQNGFELDELHDVVITGKASGDLLVATSTGWQNKSVATSGITPALIGAATASHTHLAGDLPVLQNLNGVLDVDSGGTGRTDGANLVASGGTTGQVLIKSSGTSYDDVWADTPLTNYIINGAMEVAQRGTSFSNTVNANKYTLDRFACLRDGWAAGNTLSQISSIGLNGFRYAARVQRQSGNTSTNGIWFGTPLDINDTWPLVNKQITLSAWMRKGANFSGTSLVNFGIDTGTGEGSPGASVPGIITYQRNIATELTTSWQRITFTVTPASTQVFLRPFIYYAPTGTAGANDYLDITGWQLEQGPIATPFKRFSNSYTKEVEACLSYYEQNTAYGGACWDNDYGLNAFGVFYTRKRRWPEVTLTGGALQGHIAGTPGLNSVSTVSFNCAWSGAYVRDYGARCEVSYQISAEI